MSSEQGPCQAVTNQDEWAVFRVDVLECADDTVGDREHRLPSRQWWCIGVQQGSFDNSREIVDEPVRTLLLTEVVHRRSFRVTQSPGRLDRFSLR